MTLHLIEKQYREVAAGWLNGNIKLLTWTLETYIFSHYSSKCLPKRFLTSANLFQVFKLAILVYIL